MNTSKTTYGENNKTTTGALALQHLIAMFGATVLVPLLTGFSPSIALLSAGVGTLIFHFITGGKVPVFLGSSFAFIAVINQVKDLHGGDLAYAQGGILVAGLVYVLLSFIIKRFSYENIKKLLPSYVVGPMIIIIGLTLIPTALGMASGNYLLAGVTLITSILTNLFGKGVIKKMSILVGISTGYLSALIFQLVDLSIITNADFLQIPPFTLPKFSLDAILIITPIVLAVFMEHIGDITTNGQVVGKDFIKNPGVHKTLLGDGLATIFASLIGGPANTTYGENTGVLAITKNYNPKTLRLAAVFAILLAFFGKLGGVLNSIPVPVMGGISLLLFSMIAFVGVQTLQRAYIEKEITINFKTITIILSMLIIGFAPTFLPPTISNVIQLRITDTISLSGLSLAALTGMILNIVFNLFEKK